MRDINMDMKELKEQLAKALKYKEKVSLAVKVYDCDETGEQTYDVEVAYCLDGRYEDCFVTDTYEAGEEKEAVKRGKQVLKTVRKWYQYHEEIPVKDRVKVYSM